MRDIFDIMKKDIRNKYININVELFHADTRKEDLENLIDMIMKAHEETPDAIQATASIDRNGYFIKRFQVDANMTEEVYDSIYSIYGGIIEEFKDKIELKLKDYRLDPADITFEPIQWPNPIERPTRFRDGILSGPGAFDGDGDYIGLGSWSPITVTYDEMTDLETLDVSDFLDAMFNDGRRRIH